MPKISVHLEADSADEFLSLLGTFRDFHRSTMPVSAQYEDAEPAVEPEPGPEVEQSAAVETPKELVKPKRGRPAKAAPVEPEPEPPVAVQPEPEVAQPAAAVVAAPEPVKAKPRSMPHAQPENGAATRQDLLDAFSEYVQRYGASFGFSDISSLLQQNLGDSVRKASDVPEDKLPVAIGAIKTAIADNPFNRKRDYA